MVVLRQSGMVLLHREVLIRLVMIRKSIVRQPELWAENLAHILMVIIVTSRCTIQAESMIERRRSREEMG